MTTNSLARVPECWLYKNRTYLHMVNGREARSLPHVDLEYAAVLDELKVPYRLSADGTYYEIWDPKCFKEENVTLPLYIENSNSYRMVKKHTATIITNDSVTSAHVIYDTVVEPVIEKVKKEKEMRKLADILVKTLNGRPACGVKATASSGLANYVHTELDVKHGDAHFKVLPVHLLRSEAYQAQAIEFMDDTSNLDFRRDTNYLAIFDMNRMAIAAKIEMQVPNGTEPIFVGRKGWQVKEWCEKVGGLLKIDVKPDVEAAV